MEEKYRIYKDILSKDLQTNYVFLVVFFTLMIIGTVIFAFWGKSLVQEYKKQTIKKNRKKNSTKKQKNKFILNLIVFILFCLTIIVGIPQQIIQISNLRSDIKNESFVIYDILLVTFCNLFHKEVRYDYPNVQWLVFFLDFGPGCGNGWSVFCITEGKP